MSKFKKGKGKSVPGISTASLPDIVFMLLFFFMVTTTIKETSMKVEVSPPTATEIKKIKPKSLVSYIYIGSPRSGYKSTHGESAHIQLDGEIFNKHEASQVQDFIISKRSKKKPKDIPKMTTSIKADRKVRLGIVTDVKTNLREVDALQISYSTSK